MSVSRESSPQATPPIGGAAPQPSSSATSSSAAPSPSPAPAVPSLAASAQQMPHQQQVNVPVSSLIADMARAHKHRISQLKDAAEVNYKQASSSAAVACQSLVDLSNAEVIDVFNAETKIEAQIKEVTSQAEQMHKRMAQWAQLFVKFNHALKEIGDVQHWSAMVETDMQETVKILDAVSAKKRKLIGIE